LFFNALLQIFVCVFSTQNLQEACEASGQCFDEANRIFFQNYVSEVQLNTIPFSNAISKEYEHLWPTDSIISIYSRYNNSLKAARGKTINNVQVNKELFVIVATEIRQS
jgi:hypothetical protein